MDNALVTPPRSWRRFLQFRLRTLLILPVFVALGGYWHVQHRKVEAARRAWYTTGAYKNGLTGALSRCDASLRLCHAEEQLPFTRAASARARHFARLVDLEQRARTDFDARVYDSQEDLERDREELARIAELRQEALDALDPP